jgi:Fe-S cluster biogenesis protein NfuA
MQNVMVQILERLNTLLEADGSRLSLVEMKGDQVVVGFQPGQAGACTECVMDPETLAMLVKEAVAHQLPAIDKVTLVTH